MFSILFLLCGFAAFAQDALVGTWKGTSICQVKPSPCNDEIAVYHVSKTDKVNVYRMVMNKMVNGREEDMGVTDYVYDAKAGTLVSFDKERNLWWRFSVRGERMEGTLTRDKTLYRVIKLTKSASN